MTKIKYKRAMEPSGEKSEPREEQSVQPALALPGSLRHLGVKPFSPTCRQGWFGFVCRSQFGFGAGTGKAERSQATGQQELASMSLTTVGSGGESACFSCIPVASSFLILCTPFLVPALGEKSDVHVYTSLSF